MSQVVLYSPRQVGLIREAGKVVSECLAIAREMVRPGGTTRQVDAAVAEHIRRRGGVSAFIGYQMRGKPPFPGHICASVNDVIVHGIPNDTPFKEGDLVSIDCGVRLNGYIGDAAWTFCAGQPTEAGRRLLQAGREALYAGIAAARCGGKLGAISKAVQDLAEGRGYSVVREYVGHGVGQSLHEPPEVPNYVQPGAMLPVIGRTLQAGMVLAIEPMINAGRAAVSGHKDTWPVHTADGKPSVHFEHSVAIFPDRIEILTLPAPLDAP